MRVFVAGGRLAVATLLAIALAVPAAGQWSPVTVKSNYGAVYLRQGH